MRILLLVANREAADAAESVLQETGATILRASTWPGAVELLSLAAPIDVVLAFDGPELRAFDVVRSLRALPPKLGGNTPLVLLTYDGLPASAGERAWAVRPTALETMLAALHRAAHMQ